MNITECVSAKLNTAASTIEAADSTIQTSTCSQYLGELSTELKRRIHGKAELKSPVRSFKVRGPIVAMKDMAIGTVCYTASAGNHAQGMAYAGKLYGIRVIIFIPEETDITKIDAIKRIGGDWITLVIAGKSYDEAYRLATKECQAKDGTFISAFDHIDIIAGQGTSALEFLQQQTDLDILYVPVGGGGLIAGYLAAKLHLGHPVKIIGVEPSAAPSASFALAAGMPVTIHTTATVAEGAKVARIGDLPFRIMQENHVEIIQISEPEILSAMDLLHRKEDILVEGAGALPLAGLVKQLPEIGANENVGLVLSGGNISIRRIGEAYGYAA